ncbi:MAG: efflux RND transporter periplasmic adaptor subunit [Peptostreptococcaceae bacterium]
MLIKEKFKKISKKKKVIVIVGISAVLVVGGYFLIPKNNTDVSGVVDGVTDIVETYTIPDNEKIFINGSIKPKNSKEITLEAGYEISDLKVSNGQYVNKGDALFVSKSKEILTQIDDLEQQLKDLNNQKNQASANPESDLTSINSEITKTNNEIKNLKNKSYITATAPFSGKVYINSETADEQTTPSYMTVEGTEYYMTGQVSEQDLPKISKDMSVDIYIFATEGNLTGKISSILDRPSTQTDSMMGGSGSSLSYYDVVIDFDTQENLTNGFHIQASVEVENKSPKIPTTAILQDETGSFVYKAVDGSLVKQIVEIENKTDDFAILKSGLSQNDTIIKYPTEEMKEGDIVPVDGMSTPMMEEGI